MATKYVYYFGPDGTEGDASMKNTLGGKGANLAEMARLGLPVPAGFTITTDYCNVYLSQGQKFTDDLKSQVAEALGKVEKAMGMKSATRTIRCWCRAVLAPDVPCPA